MAKKYKGGREGVNITSNMINRTGLVIQPYTFTICFLIVAAWVISALSHDLSLFQTQNSRLLLGFGAVNGESLRNGEYWKLLTSQFLHVVLLHMLLNVGFIYLIGAEIEKHFGSRVFLSIYLIAGTTGQIASVLTYPVLVSSGASQALCGIAGAFFALMLTPLTTSKGRIICTVIFVATQIFLDLYFAAYIKAGHSVGFLTGLLLGVGARMLHHNPMAIKR